MLFSFDASVTQFIACCHSASSYSSKFCSGVKKKAGMRFSFTMVNRSYPSPSPRLEFFLVTDDARSLLSNVSEESLPSFFHLND